MSQPLEAIGKIRLRDFHPGYHAGCDKDETKSETKQLCQRIGEMQRLLYANSSQTVVLLFQGMDASGKDGAVKNVLRFVNPAGVETTSFKQPSAEEKAHDFLWRVHQAVPRFGHLGVWNRSHYEDVLIARVLQLVPEKIWQARYEQINAFEEILAQNRVVLLKFFLHISKEEQAKRFHRRLEIPSHRWKFSTGDLEMRAHWSAFQKAYEEVLNRCSTAAARWHIIPGDHKWYRDFAVAQITAAALEKLDLKWPEPAEDLSSVKL